MGIQESYNRVAGEIQSQSDLISQIKTALAGKAAGGSGVTLPDIAEDVLGKASDLAANKQLIDSNGNVVTGTLGEVPTGSSIFGTHDHVVGGTNGDTKFNVKATWDGAGLDGAIIRGGICPGVRNVPTSLLGDAQLSDVAKGKTFTSAAGYLAVGNMEPSSGGVELPDIDDSVLGSASDLVEGKKLIAPDGTVVTGEIPKRTSSDLTESGITVTAPAGYYASEAKKTVTVPTETKTVTSNGTYTPSSGKYFSSFTVNVGTSSGYKSGDIVKAFPASATLVSGYNVSSVSASDSVKKDENGVVSLSGMTSTVAIGSIDNVKDHYVKASSGSIYYVPAGATITQGGTTYNKTYTVDKANLMFVLA